VKRRCYRFRIRMWETHNDLHIRFCPVCKTERELGDEQGV
jgi:hypothetical protein